MELYSYPPLSISNCVTIKLTERNYLLWKSQFESFLRSQMLLGFVTGDIKKPAETIPVRNKEGFIEEVSNPDSEAWCRSDQVVTAWLLGSMSEDVLSVVVGSATAQEVWLTLATHFNKPSSSRLFELQRRLQNSLKLDRDLDEYLKDIKKICDQLASIGNPVTEKRFRQRI